MPVVNGDPGGCSLTQPVRAVGSHTLVHTRFTRDADGMADG